MAARPRPSPSKRRHCHTAAAAADAVRANVGSSSVAAPSGGNPTPLIRSGARGWGDTPPAAGRGRQRRQPPCVPNWVRESAGRAASSQERAPAAVGAGYGKTYMGRGVGWGHRGSRPHEVEDGAATRGGEGDMATCERGMALGGQGEGVQTGEGKVLRWLETDGVVRGAWRRAKWVEDVMRLVERSKEAKKVGRPLWR